MAVFQDNFTGSSGTNLDSHTPDTGTSWTKQFDAGGGTNMQLDGSGNVDGGDGSLSDGNLYSADASYPTADYSVEAVIGSIAGSDDPIILGARCSDQGAVQDGYFLYISSDFTELFKITGGTPTLLDEDLSNFAGDGDTIKLEVIGTSIKGYINGVERLSATDSSETGAGYAVLGMGAYFYGGDDMGSQSVNTFTVTNLGSVATYNQEGFAFGEDNGNEASHTLETQDTNLTEELDTPRTLRILIDTDDGSTDNAYKLKYQKNGTGGYADVPVGATLPGSAGAIESADVTESGNNTATNSWAVSHPAAADGDLLIFNIGWDDSTTVDGLTAPNGQNGETPITVQDVAASSGTAVRGKIVAYKCNGAWTSGSLTFTPSGSEQWTAMVIKVPAGEFDPTTPIGASNNLPSSTTETTPDIPSLSAGASDGGGRVVGMIVGDADDATGNPSGYTEVLARDRGAVAMNLYTRDSLATDSESISLASGATFPTSRAWVSFIYIVRPPADTNNEVFISTSSNVASGGEATTARLAAPSGKTTGDFDTGRRWDDENGSDSVAIGDGEYTELEWIITIQSPGDTDDYYDFRVYKGDAALDTYTVTPRWTIGVGATEAQSTTAGQILAESLTRSTTAGQIDAVSFYTFDTSAGQIFLESHSKATTAGQIVLESAPQYSVTAGQIVIRTRTNKVVLVSPLSGFESTPVTFVWECPDNVDNKAVQFHIQVDNNSDFSSPLHEKKSSVDSGFEYWDGDSWETVPVTGVPAAYYGNDVRIQLPFSVNEVVYWRVRGGAS